MRDNIRKLTPRNMPVQERAVQRRDQILSTTAELLDEVGLDDLTTILIAKRIRMSVGTLYHYFPNKYAILNDLAEQWLSEIEQALTSLEADITENMSLKQFVEISTSRLYQVYTSQKGLLPLVKAMSGVPELKRKEEEYHRLVVTVISSIFKQLDISTDKNELSRTAREWKALNHVLFLMALNSTKGTAEKTVSDLKFLCLALLERAKNQF